MKTKPSGLDIKPRRTLFGRLTALLLPLLMASAWTGCKQQGQVAHDANPAGTYSLISVDGNKMPGALQHEGVMMSVKSGLFIINPDGTCSSRIVFALPSGGDVTRDVKASYTREGSKLTMQWQGAGMTIGSVEGDTFTMNNEGMIFAYRKQANAQP